jgi:hypothetical protein
MDTGYAPKNKIVPHIIKGFFTEEEVAEILAIVEKQKIDESLDSFYRPLILPKMSRMQIEVLYPEYLVKKLEMFASEIAGEELKMYHNSYLSYNLEHAETNDANPKLPPHYDSDNYFSKLTLDYQLDKNINWTIHIEEDSFDLEYGDLLVFWGAGQVHWRKPFLFREKDNTEVLTMHFSKKEDFETLNGPARQTEARDARLEMWGKVPEYVRYWQEYQEENALIAKEGDLLMKRRRLQELLNQNNKTTE